MTESPVAPHASEQGYSLIMRVLHAVMAVMMFYVIIVGFLMGYGVKVGAHYDYHRATGILLMILVIVRLLAYRFTQPPSPLPSTISPTQQRVAHSVHFLLYASLILNPILGWYATNAWGVAKIPFFFGLHLPPIAEKDRELGNYLLELHFYSGIFITVLVLLHIAGVMYHQFVLRDKVLMRMIRR